MQKMSQTEEMAKLLAGRARRHVLTPEQVSRAMEEQDFDPAGLDELYAALETRHAGSCGSKSDAEAGCTDLPCIYHGNPYDSGICIRTYVYPCDRTWTIRRTAYHVTLFDRYDQ